MELPESERPGQEHGWNFHLSRLSLVSNRNQLEAELPDLVDRYFQAWNVESDEERATLLSEAVTDDVEFADDYAVLSGRELLALHASNTRKYIPGSSIRRAGSPLICRGEALVRWETVGADGSVLFDGTNHLRVTEDGRIDRVVGFWASGPFG